MAGIAVGRRHRLARRCSPGPICGASMNPARSLAPAVVSGALGHLWIYLTAPVLGAAVAVPWFFWNTSQSGIELDPRPAMKTRNPGSDGPENHERPGAPFF